MGRERLLLTFERGIGDAQMAALAAVNARSIGEVQVHRYVVNDRLPNALRRVQGIEHRRVANGVHEAEAQVVEALVEAVDLTVHRG